MLSTMYTFKLESGFGTLFLITLATHFACLTLGYIAGRRAILKSDQRRRDLRREQLIRGIGEGR